MRPFFAEVNEKLTAVAKKLNNLALRDLHEVDSIIIRLGVAQ